MSSSKCMCPIENFVFRLCCFLRCLVEWKHRWHALLLPGVDNLICMDWRWRKLCASCLKCEEFGRGKEERQDWDTAHSVHAKFVESGIIAYKHWCNRCLVMSLITQLQSVLQNGKMSCKLAGSSCHILESWIKFLYNFYDKLPIWLISVNDVRHRNYSVLNTIMVTFVTGVRL